MIIVFKKKLQVVYKATLFWICMWCNKNNKYIDYFLWFSFSLYYFESWNSVLQNDFTCSTHGQYFLFVGEHVSCLFRLGLKLLLLLPPLKAVHVNITHQQTNYILGYTTWTNRGPFAIERRGQWRHEGQTDTAVACKPKKKQELTDHPEVILSSNR